MITAAIQRELEALGRDWATDSDGEIFECRAEFEAYWLDQGSGFEEVKAVLRRHGLPDSLYSTAADIAADAGYAEWQLNEALTTGD